MRVLFILHGERYRLVPGESGPVVDVDIGRDLTGIRPIFFDRLRQVLIDRIKGKTLAYTPGNRFLERLAAATGPKDQPGITFLHLLEVADERQIGRTDGGIGIDTQCAVKIHGDDLVLASLDIFYLTVHGIPSVSMVKWEAPGTCPQMKPALFCMYSIRTSVLECNR